MAEIVRETLAGERLLRPFERRAAIAFLVTAFGFFVACTVDYYLGEIATWLNWRDPRLAFFYEIHDTHRLFFLIPMVLAAWRWKLKGAAVAAVATLVVILPRAFFVSPFPNPLLRSVLFVVVSGVGVALLVGLAGGRWATPRVQHSLAEAGRLAGGLSQENQDGVYTRGDLRVDLPRRVVRRGNRIIKLTPKEYELLSYMVLHNGRVLTHGELLKHVWGPEYGGESEYLRTFVAQLRRKIGDSAARPQFIVTEQGVGYRFVEL